MAEPLYEETGAIYTAPEYPKFLPRFNVVAENAAAHRALLEGRATVEVVLKAQSGDVRAIVPKPVEAEEPKAVEPPPEPLVEPEAMIAAAQETFTRRKSKRKGK